MTESLQTEQRTAFEQYLRSNGLRCTQERLVVAETAATYGTMFTAEDIHRSVEAKGYRISIATVYNTLRMLTEASLVMQHAFDPSCTRFEYLSPSGSQTRLHLICTVCGRIRDAKDPELMSTIRAKRYSTFTTSHCAVYIYGVCGRCRRKTRKPKACRGKQITKTDKHI